MSKRNRPADYERRDVLRAGLGLGLGAVALGCQPGAADEQTGQEGEARTNGARVQKRVALGKTGVEVPDVGFGTFSLNGDTALVKLALDRGVTHFDTALDYQDGNAEKTLGEALRGHRDAVTLTTKTVAAADARADELMQRLEGSLRRLQTDYVDFYLNHAVDTLERVHNPEWMRFVERAKQQGKLRFSGMSGHGPHLVTCLEAAFAAGQLDVVLVAYNYIQTPDFLDSAKLWAQRKLGRLDWVSLQPELPDFLARAKAAGVGVMTMKTLRGARHNDMRPYESGGSTFAQAALRWVLSDERVDAAVITMTSPALIDEYLQASGGARPSGRDVALLTGYEQLNHSSQCVAGCGDCADACPVGVPISEVMRMGMYDRDYRQPAIAGQGYAALERDASACLSCSGAPCAERCPMDIPIAERLREIDARLRS